MTSKEKMAAYLIEKIRLIEDFTDLKYLDPEDIKEISAWSEKDCQRFFLQLRNSDVSSCPWCYLYYVKYCEECGYAERHGGCGLPDSRYEKLKKRIREKFSDIRCDLLMDIPGMEELNMRMSTRNEAEEITFTDGGSE